MSTRWSHSLRCIVRTICGHGSCPLALAYRWSADTTGFPVSRIRFSGTPSAKRLAKQVLVGA